MKASRRGGGSANVSKQGSNVSSLHKHQAAGRSTDKPGVRITEPDRNQDAPLNLPWAMQIKAISIEEPTHLVQTMTGAILGVGGWVLSRSSTESGRISLLFEFERRACINIYCVLIAAGLELSQSGHIRFTELCQCTLSSPVDCNSEIVSIDLEIQTFPMEMLQEASSDPA